jgi:RNA polymerase sigma factor (sigma-70 family)
MNKEEFSVKRLKEGDMQGLEDIANAYYFQALRSSFFITLDLARSEDIVQTVFLRLCDKIKHYDDGLPFRPWLMRVVVNATLDDLRKDKKYTYIDDIETENGIAYFEQLVDANSLPDVITEISEMKEAIWRALEKLSPNQRAVVVQYYYLGMNESEISGAMKAPKSSIKWWLRSSRQNLRKFLDSLADTGDKRRPS